MELELRELTVDCIIGDLPDERNRLQSLRVSVTLELGDEAALTDAIEDTVDYVELTAAIRETLVAAKCRLVERAARLAAECALRDPRVTRARVEVTKTGTVPGLAAAVARCELENHA